MEVFTKYIEGGQSMAMFAYNYKKMSDCEQQSLIKLVTTFEGTRIELYDLMLAATNGWNNGVEAYDYGIIYSFRPSLIKEQEVVNVRIKGPFTVEQYDDPVFVENYVEVKYSTRVADIKAIIQDLEGVIYALGDGAGTCYRAVQELRDTGSNLICCSYDSSVSMIEEAEKRHNVVNLGDFSLDKVPLDAIIFLSHVVDYLPYDFFDKISDRKVIFFEKYTHFQGCYNLIPYKNMWGYQICSRNVTLKNIVPLSTMMVVSELDYSLLGIFLNPGLGDVIIANNCAEYKVLFDPYVSQLTGFKPAIVASEEFDCYPGTVVACPRFGVIDHSTAALRGLMPVAKYRDFFLSYNGYFSRRPTVCAGTIAVDCSKAYARCDKTIIQLTIVKGDLPYASVKKKYNSIEIIDCHCWDQPVHNHVLKVVDYRLVEVLNLINDVRRLGIPLKRYDIIQYYVNNVLDKDAFARITHKLENCEFTAGGRYIGLKANNAIRYNVS